MGQKSVSKWAGLGFIPTGPRGNSLDSEAQEPGWLSAMLSHAISILVLPAPSQSSGVEAETYNLWKASGTVGSTEDLREDNDSSSTSWSLSFFRMLQVTDFATVPWLI